MNNLPKNDAEFNLQQVLLVMNYLSQWLIRSGVGYSEFAAALKPIFYQQAVDEIVRIDKKATISAISLLSGLHRKDITAFNKITTEKNNDNIEPNNINLFSIPARVLNLWVTENWPIKMPFYNQKIPSFVTLSQKISTEVHPRSVLNELLRLGIVTQEKKQVILQKKSFIPDQSTQEIRELLSSNLQSHLAAGIHNIFLISGNSFLEDCIRADELTSESVNILKEYSIKLWEEYANQITKLALERCNLDEGKSEANQKFCLGIYQSDI